MRASVHTGVPAAGSTGVHTTPVHVHVDHQPDLPPAIAIHGLGRVAELCLRDRLRAGFGNSTLGWPTGRLEIRLDPLELPKPTSALDLPVAIAILAATGHIPATFLAGLWAAGELGLNGGVRSSIGIADVATAAAAAAAALLVVPKSELPSIMAPAIARAGTGTVVGVSSLDQFVAWAHGLVRLPGLLPRPAHVQPSGDEAPIRMPPLGR